MQAFLRFAGTKQWFVRFCLMVLMMIGWSVGFSQPWTYDFGTGTGTPSGVFTSTTASTTYLPAPSSGGGTARVRVGTNPGSISLINPGLASLGSGSELQIVSNTGSASTTKFSIHDYTAAKIGYIKFKIAFSGGTNGVYQFALGDGATFSDNNALATAQIFAGIQWTFGASNTITYRVLNSATYGTTGITNSTTQFVQSTSIVYSIEVYANNNTTSSIYNRSGTNYTINSGTWDLWIDGTRVGTNLARGGIANDVNLDSYAFNHQSSVTSPGTLYLDDFEYSNTLPNVCTAPTTQASNISFSNIQSNQMDVNWTNGNGAGRVVLMNTSNSFTAPTNGSNPAASLAYGGSGQQVVFNGTGSGPITVTGLNASTTYWFRVYEYCSPDRTYNTSTGTNNPNSQATVSAGPSTNANLSALSLSTGTLAPAFAANTTSYSATVPFTTSSITVTATKADANATLQVRVNSGSYTALTSGSPSGSLALNTGSNTIDVLVTAEDGTTTKTYTTTVTRTAASTNADLSSLSTAAGVFSPAFNAAVTSYSVSVANGVTSTTVSATVADATASLQVRINGGSYASLSSGAASSALSLNVGANTIDVLVTAQDGTTTKTYTLTVNRAASLSSNADLSALTTTAGTLSPAFDAGTTAYTASVLFNVSSVTVTATKADPGATLQVRVNGGAYSSLTSGSASAALSLNVGTNPIDVLVTAEDGTTTKTYTITVTRAAASTVSSLSSMAFSTGTLSPSFASNVTAYTTSVSNSTTSVTVTSVVTDAASSIQVRVNGGSFTSVASGAASGALALIVGNNTVDVRVTAEDGTTTTTYTTTVTRTVDLPGAPTLNSVTVDAPYNYQTGSNTTNSSGKLRIAFTAGTNGGATITDYEYSTDGGSTFKSAGTTTSPIIISTVSGSNASLVNGTSYAVQLRAVNSAGSGTSTSSINATPQNAVQYQDFGTGTGISAKPFTGAPSIFETGLLSSSWTTNQTLFGSLSGNTGRALSLTNSSGTNTFTLTFTVPANSRLNINGFDFWRERSGTGAQNWSLSINGTTVGSGTIPSTGTTIGYTPVSSSITNLTGTVTIVYTMSGASGNGTTRFDDFVLYGSVTQLTTPPVLTAASGATVDNAFNVTFTDDPASQSWVAAGGTTVTVGGTPLTAGFSIANGQITFTPSASIPAGLLQTAGANKAIVISKTGYADATVSQTISAGAPAQITVNTQPTAPTLSGGTLATQPTVTVRDQYANAVGSGITVNAAVTSGQTSNWSLGGTTSATTNASGVATFSDLTATNLGSSAFTTATITFTPGSGSGSVSSNTFTVPAPASKLAITSITPASPSAGSGFNVTVQSQDAGNTATNVLTATGISLTTNGNAGAISGTTTGTINAGSNSVTITGVVLPNAGTGVTLTATQTSGSPTLTAGTSNTFTVLDAASYLTFENVPATGSAGTNLSSFTVSARRSSDNSIDQSFTGSITISKNSGLGTLSGTLSVNAVNGVAIFNTAQFNQAGTYTLAASSGSLTGATSGNIVVSLANATVILWSSAGGSAWLTNTNWTGAAVPTSTQVAQFGVNPTPGTAANINGGTTTTGAIELNSNRLLNLTIGNSSGTASNGILTLNGVVVNGVPNVIIRNNSVGNLTIQNTGSTGNASNTMALALGNTSDNVIQIENSGNINISSVITGTGRSLTKAGNGSGVLTLSGNNTYTGATTVTGGTLSIPKTGYTATITTTAVTVAFSPAPAIGTYTFLPGALTNGGQTFSATGLAPNQTASFNFANSTVTVSLSQAAADYRSKQSGNLNDASTWEFFNGIAWTDATQVPSSTNNVTVQNGHTITQDANFTVGTSKSLTLDATSGWVVNPNVILTVTGTANFNNQSVVFRSTASGDGMFGNSSGTINGGGNVTVERYLGSVNKRAWRLLTAPVNGSTNNSVFFNWQNNGVATGNSGAEIWGPAGTGAGGNGLAVGPLSSLRTFNNATQSFVDVTNSKTQPLFNTSDNNPTFYLFLSGPYGSGNITNTSIFSPTTLRATGSLLTGAKTFSTTAAANGFYFVSNPYASTVNQGNSGSIGSPVYPLNISNATNAIYFWDPNLAGLFGAGGYVAFDRLQNTYSIPPGEGPAGTLTYQSGTNYTRLQSGSAFVLQAVNAGTISVDFTEASKGGAASPGVFRTIGNTSEKLRVTLQRSSNGNYITTDGAVAFYYDNANAGVDLMDATKFNNNSDNLMLRRNGRSLTFEHRPTVAQNDTLFIGLANTTATTYRFAIEASDFAATAGLRAVLQDLYLNTETPVGLFGTTTVVFTVDGNAASTGNNRFRIVLRPDAATSVRNADAEKWLKVYPNPVAKGASLQVELKNRTAGTYQMALYNALGMQVFRMQFVHGGSNTVQRIQLPATLSNGVYVAEIMDAKGNKEEIKITIQ